MIIVVSVCNTHSGSSHHSDHSLCKVFTPSYDHMEHTLLSVHSVYNMHCVCGVCNLYTDHVVFGAPSDHHGHGVRCA